MRLLLLLLLWLLGPTARGQASRAYADSVRRAYGIPELAYAVVAADTVLQAQVLGVQRQHTSFLAWSTPFLALFPELRTVSRRCYRGITLQDLLTFRGRLPAYTYTFAEPTPARITGDNATQRLLLARYFLAQPPMKAHHGLTPSNADYILAGLMLEKATGKTYQELVTNWGRAHGIAFGFDYPNRADLQQPWGHGPDGNPQPPADNYKLNWLLSAGNLNVSLPDYAKFMQLQLRGLTGNSAELPQPTFGKLLFGRPTFAFGWFNKTDAATRHHIAYNEGNAGAFTTQVQLIRETGRAYVVFANSATPATAAGITVLLAHLQEKYGR